MKQERLTREEFRTRVWRSGSQHKYRAKPVEMDGIRFDSTREAKRCAELRIMEQAGEIEDLILQPVFELQPAFTAQQTARRVRAITYRADFSYRFSGSSQVIVEDVKGFETPTFRIKQKMFLFHHPDKHLRIVR